MLQKHTVCYCKDNSGAKFMKILNLYGGAFRRYAYFGDMVRTLPKKVKGTPHHIIRKSRYKKVKKRGKYLSLIISTKWKKSRPDGTWIRSSCNNMFNFSAPLVYGPHKKTDHIPILMGSRIFIGLPREIEQTEWGRKKYKRVLYFVNECY